MYEQINNYNLLAAEQYGFRKLHSTEYAAAKLIDHVSKQIEAGNIPCNFYYRSFESFRYLVLSIY